MSSTPPPTAGPSGEQTRSGLLQSWPVELTGDLVNSNWSGGPAPVEWFPDLESLDRYLRHNMQERDAADLAPSDLTGIRQLRGQLRRVFEVPDETGRVVIINALCEEYLRGVTLTAADGAAPRLVPRPSSAAVWHRLAAQCALALAQLAEAGLLERLKTCSRAGCDGVIVDRTRPMSRRFCCRQCATAVASATYRRRRRDTTRTES